MQSKKLEELRTVLPLNKDDKEVISVAVKLIRTLREDVAELQHEIDVLKQTPAPAPEQAARKRKRRWLF